MTCCSNQLNELMMARQVVATALASALADPLSPQARRGEGLDSRIIETAWEVVCEAHAELPATELGIGERRPHEASVAALGQWLHTARAIRESCWQRIFGLVVSRKCPPYETEYCPSKDTTHRAQEMADIAGFYHAFALTPGRAHPERIDCISLEIEFIAFVLARWQAAAGCDCHHAHAQTCKDALAAFVRDHLGWWAPTFGRLLEQHAFDCAAAAPSDEQLPMRLLAETGKVLCAWVAMERSLSGVAPSRRIISPAVAQQEPGDPQCGDCDSCDDLAADQSATASGLAPSRPM